jgi:hypothetical protein
MTFKEFLMIIGVSFIVSMQFIQLAVIEDYLDKMEDRMVMNLMYIHDMSN